MGRESSMECSDSFLWTKEIFRYEIVFRRIYNCFYEADRSAWLVFNQPRQRGTETRGTLCFYKGFMDVFYILTSA